MQEHEAASSLDAVDGTMRAALTRIGRADVVVGIPSFRNAATIGHVATTVRAGLARLGVERVAIVNADGGSEDGTSDRVREAAGDVPSVIGRYVGPPGKGSALRAVFACAKALGARAAAVVDSDLRSISPEWIERLVRPILDGDADYVTPLYARHKYDGTITNAVAYPLTRALYGKRIRQPIGGEFGFSGEIAALLLDGGALRDGGGAPRGAGGATSGDAVTNEIWSGDVAKFGIDIFMTTTALADDARVVQAFLGAKVHDPKDPGADLAPMFEQVVGTAFRLAERNARVWRDVQGSVDIPVVGASAPVEPEAITVDVEILRRKAADGAKANADLWSEVLSAPVPGAEINASDWARIVYDFTAAAGRDVARANELARGLVPLYYARTATVFDEFRSLDSAGAERVVEAQAQVFEEHKDHLRGRWP